MFENESQQLAVATFCPEPVQDLPVSCIGSRQQASRRVPDIRISHGKFVAGAKKLHIRDNPVLKSW
jgi:hypothetical protein